MSPAKPVMFEEFGKKLDPAQQTTAAIERLRDPVYSSTYASVENAINANQPIAGSMFWKLAIPVFDRQDPRGEWRRRSGAAVAWRGVLRLWWPDACTAPPASAEASPGSPLPWLPHPPPQVLMACPSRTRPCA
jgi:hypothetical protein